MNEDGWNSEGEGEVGDEELPEDVVVVDVEVVAVVAAEDLLEDGLVLLGEAEDAVAHVHADLLEEGVLDGGFDCLHGLVEGAGVEGEGEGVT